MKILPLLLLGSAFVFGQSGGGKITSITPDKPDGLAEGPIAKPKPAGKKKAPVLDGIVTFNACQNQKWIGMAKWKGADVRCSDLLDAINASDLAWMIDAPSEPIDVPAIDVPAIQETRQMRDIPEFIIDCGLAETLKLQGLMAQCLKQIPGWTCPDKHSYTLQASVDGEVRICHRIKP